MQEEDELTSELKRLRKNETWLLFMNRVREELPFLYEPGRPRIQTIMSSVIGRSGYGSWSAYITHCLEWNDSGWLAWRRAYNVVQKYPYLEKVQASPSMINLRAIEEDTFPPDAQSWDELQKALHEKKHLSRLDKLEKRIETLEAALMRLEKPTN
jgi:hypothetical protein